MKIIAITGGIASGKTTVCKFFQQCGAKIIDADRLAHRAYDYKTPVYQAILRRYGKKILRKDKKINRKRLAKILFNSKKEKKWLEARIHPTTQKLIQEKIKLALLKRPPLVLVEAALHVETGYYKKFMGLIVVDISKKVQLERLMKRDRITRKEALLRLKNQFPLHRKRTIADWVIDNSGRLSDTKAQVRKLYKVLVGN